MIGQVGLLLIVLGLFGFGFAWIEKIVQQNSGPIDLTGPGTSVKQISFPAMEFSRRNGLLIGLGRCVVDR